MYQVCVLNTKNLNCIPNLNNHHSSFCCRASKLYADAVNDARSRRTKPTAVNTCIMEVVLVCFYLNLNIDVCVEVQTKSVGPKISSQPTHPNAHVTEPTKNSRKAFLHAKRKAQHYLSNCALLTISPSRLLCGDGFSSSLPARRRMIGPLQLAIRRARCSAVTHRSAAGGNQFPFTCIGIVKISVQPNQPAEQVKNTNAAACLN